MSYQSIAQLTDDVWFAARIRSCTVEQAETYKDDARPDWVAVADACLAGNGEMYNAFARIAAAGPGFAETAGDPPDQTLIADDDILASVQANWPTVAALYYSEDGAPI